MGHLRLPQSSLNVIILSLQAVQNKPLAGSGLLASLTPGIYEQLLPVYLWKKRLINGSEDMGGLAIFSLLKMEMKPMGDIQMKTKKLTT